MTATAPPSTPIESAGTIRTDIGTGTPADGHDDEPRLPRLVEITPWVDPLVDRRGHDPRSSYVEQFWLGTLGPTATWLTRRLVAGFDEFPAGYPLDLVTTAQSMGLSFTKGSNGPFARALGRCVMFGVAHRHAGGYAVRRRLPEVARRHLLRLPDDVQVAHQRWVGAVAGIDTLARGRTLATAMLAAGDDAELLEPQLVALGIAPPTAAQVIEIVRHEPAVAHAAPR